ncbi:unnamed protein product [Closterium sp. Naga37s-1]|nr:unnamed protein product [Closterium sp. Naga37s-1]
MAEKPGAVPARADFPCSRSPRQLSSSATAPPPSAFRARKGGRVVRARAGDKDVKGEGLDQEGQGGKEDGRDGEQEEVKERGRILAEIAWRTSVLGQAESAAFLNSFLETGNESAGKETAGKGAEVAARGRGSDVTATGGGKDGQGAEGTQGAQGGQDVIIGGQVVRVTQEDIDIAEMIEVLESAFEELEEKMDDGGNEEAGKGKGKGKGEGEREGKGRQDGKGEGEDGGKMEGVAATTGAAMAGQYLWAWSYRTDTTKPPSPLYFLPLFAPDIGLVTLITQVVAPVPSRVALLDLTFLSSSAAIFSSFALLQASAAFPFPPAPFSFPSDLSSLGFEPAVSRMAEAAAAATAAGGSVSGVIPVNPGLLQHSALLHELLIRLHVSAVSLLPAVGLPGGDILYALVRDPLVLSLATTAVTIMLLVSIPLNFSWTWVLLFLLLPLLALAKIRRPVSEALTAPDPVRVCLGVGLLTAGVVVLLPAPLFELVFGEPAGPVAEQILISLGLG